MDALISSLMAYGYWGLFLLMVLDPILPTPSETIITLAGTLIAAKKLDLIPSLAAVAAGSVIGSAIAYAIGRYLGRHVLVKYGRWVGIKPEHMVKGEHWLNRYKVLMLIFGRYIAGVRQVIPYLAGIGRISWFDFTVYTVIGSILWAVTFLVLGRTLTTLFHPVAAWTARYWYIVAPVVIVGLGLFIWRRQQTRHARQEPGDQENTQNTPNA
ncbi:DedA family protein [Kyrpidia tusciae]|uniref:SNARE associated Golgi protein-associated protein n=1 Tax=Kyrpidia tusciae (strain DSM 2912 / NBRC 15312 / T2) TaxID=562970 RepID=D5WR04_KYRT2|nr:DedA family protein [Kyrpidia tusciae]ADG04794.1 SNARE associated Golgi protein-associated protein [Kyrpidia tusciae DSM 2912]